MVCGGKVENIVSWFFIPALNGQSLGGRVTILYFSHVSRSFIFPYIIYFWLVPLETLHCSYCQGGLFLS